MVNPDTGLWVPSSEEERRQILGKDTNPLLSPRCPLGCHWKRHRHLLGEHETNYLMPYSPMWSKIRLPKFNFSSDSAPSYLPKEGLWCFLDGGIEALVGVPQSLVASLNYDDHFGFTLRRLNRKDRPLVLKAMNLRASFGQRFLTSELDLQGSPEFRDCLCWETALTDPSQLRYSLTKGNLLFSFFSF
jgi:hypothetical protein